MRSKEKTSRLAFAELSIALEDAVRKLRRSCAVAESTKTPQTLTPKVTLSSDPAGTKFARGRKRHPPARQPDVAS